MALLLLGLGHWMKVDTVLGTLSVVGGSVLIWMGYGMLRSSVVTEKEAASREASEEAPREAAAPCSTISPETPEVDAGGVGTTRRPSRAHAVSVGIRGGIVSLRNPYWILWWSTVGAGFVATSSKLGPRGVAAFYTGHILADFTWFSLLSVALAAGRQAIKPRTYQWIVALCGVFLIGLAVTFVVRGIQILS